MRILLIIKIIQISGNYRGQTKLLRRNLEKIFFSWLNTTGHIYTVDTVLIHLFLRSPKDVGMN